MRAILLAKATGTSIFGLPGNICDSQPRPGRCTAQTGLTDHRAGPEDEQGAKRPLAPLRYGAEFLLAPGRFLSGVSPSQAAKSRPDRKLLAAGTSAVMAVAAIEPKPGIVISGRATESAFERRLIS